MPRTLQEQIKKLRKKGEITQEEVALRMKMSRSTYARKEVDGSFSDEELKRLAKILSTSYESISKFEIGTGESVLVRNPQELTAQGVVRSEVTLRVVLRYLAEVVANHRGVPLEAVLKEMEALGAAEAESTLALLKLRQEG